MNVGIAVRGMELFDLAEVREKFVVAPAVIIDYFTPVIVVLSVAACPGTFDWSEFVHTKVTFFGLILTRVDGCSST